MLFPWCGGANDGRSVFVTIENTTKKSFEPGQVVLIPRDASLKDDDRYIASCRAVVDAWINPLCFGNAKLLSAEFWAD